MSYRDFYSEANNDPYQGTYTNILAEYRTGTGTNTPANLRSKVYGTGNAGGPINHVMLVRESSQDGEGPGKVIGYHGATRHDARIGLSTPFDNTGFSQLHR